MAMKHYIIAAVSLLFLFRVHCLPLHFIPGTNQNCIAVTPNNVDEPGCVCLGHPLECNVKNNTGLQKWPDGSEDHRR